MFLLFACATKPSWGRSEEEALVAELKNLASTQNDEDSVLVTVFPRINQVGLHFSNQSFYFMDRTGNFPALKDALNKYLEWNKQLGRFTFLSDDL
jgi:hypothetical protein